MRRINEWQTARIFTWCEGPRMWASKGIISLRPGETPEEVRREYARNYRRIIDHVRLEIIDR